MGGTDELEVGFLRNGQSSSVNLVPTTVKKTSRTGGREESYVIGIMGGDSLAESDYVVVRTFNPAKAFSRGVTDTLQWDWFNFD